MRIQIVNFNLKGLTPTAYQKLCEELAPAFASVPGLVSKVWLCDESTNIYGGVYTWDSAESMAAFTKTDLFQAVVNHPNLENLTARDFGVLESPSRVTGGIKAKAA